MKFVGLLLIFISNLSLSSPREPGDAFSGLNIDLNRTTISGLSSGGFMAVQFEIAHSDIIHGAAIFAGGIYGCADENLGKALTTCMTSPEDLRAQSYAELVLSSAKLGLIANPKNLKNHMLFLFAGSADSTVRPASTEKLYEFYQSFVPLNQIKKITKIPAEHGLPTMSYGSSCGTGGTPWLLNCSFDGAGAALSQLYGKLNAAQPANASHLIHFDQTPDSDVFSNMNTEGSIYIPQACSAGQTCALHIALHGCWQGPEFLKDEFAIHAGFNEWAENNHIVILYPSVLSSTLNPRGCWDWWGYTGPGYETQNGPQIKTLDHLIQRILKK